MEEVERRLEPLTRTVGVVDKTLRSLYSNGSGGPPGYLENARAEDKEQSRRLFGLIRGLEVRLAKVEVTIDRNSVLEDKRDEDKLAAAELVAAQLKESEKKFNRRIAVIGIILSILTLIFGFWNHHPAISKVLAPFVGQTQQPSPIDASNPPY